MPHFTILTDDDGSVRQLLVDGVPHEGGIKLEQVFAIVSTYFKLAADNLHVMASCNDDELLRKYGLQSFLMSLTAIEAFTNVFFTLLGMQKENSELLKVAGRRSGPLLKRLRACLGLAFAEPLSEQELLLEQIGRLYSLRNQIVHPRWEPASMTIGGDTTIHIKGLTQSFQASFESETLCMECYQWCLLLVIRVARAAGNRTVDGFCFHWTGEYGLSEEEVLAKLGIQRD